MPARAPACRRYNFWARSQAWRVSPKKNRNPPQNLPVLGSNRNLHTDHDPCQASSSAKRRWTLLESSLVNELTTWLPANAPKDEALELSARQAVPKRCVGVVGTHDLQREPPVCGRGGALVWFARASSRPGCRSADGSFVVIVRPPTGRSRNEKGREIRFQTPRYYWVRW